MRLEVSKVIDRPVGAVFEWYAASHVRNHPRWNPDIELWLDADEPLAVGTVIRRRNSMGESPVEGTMEVVEYDPPRAFSVVIHDGPVEILGGATFESPAADRTGLHVWAEFPEMPEEAATHVQGLMQRSVDTIKDLLEAEVPA